MPRVALARSLRSAHTSRTWADVGDRDVSSGESDAGQGRRSQRWQPAGRVRLCGNGCRPGPHVVGVQRHDAADHLAVESPTASADGPGTTATRGRRRCDRPHPDGDGRPAHADEADPERVEHAERHHRAPTPRTTPAPTTTDPASVAGSCERTLPAYPVLQPGAKGPAVRALQCFLNDADYGPVAVDGDYGAQTRAAVKKVEASFEGPAPKPGRIDAGMWVLLISRTLGDETLEVGSKGAERRDSPAGPAGRRRHHRRRRRLRSGDQEGRPALPEGQPRR